MTCNYEAKLKKAKEEKNSQDDILFTACECEKCNGDVALISKLITEAVMGTCVTVGLSPAAALIGAHAAVAALQTGAERFAAKEEMEKIDTRREYFLNKVAENNAKMSTEKDLAEEGLFVVKNNGQIH